MSHVIESHVIEHCNLPPITRHWRRLGTGAMWSCGCGRLYRLVVEHYTGCDLSYWKGVAHVADL